MSVNAISDACPRCLGEFRERTWVSWNGEVQRSARAGQLLFCAHCTALLVFSEDLTLRPILEGEVAEIRRTEPAYWEFLTGVRLQLAAGIFSRALQ